jgi:hypothetical protein
LEISKKDISTKPEPIFPNRRPQEPPSKSNFVKYAPFLAKESGIKPWDILAVVAQTGNSTKESKKEIDGKNKTQTNQK